MLAGADMRVDVGRRSDPATGDFDHHQKGGAGERPNGIRYASFGLVWRQLGAQLGGGDEAAAAIDERLVQGVDANDTGQTSASALVDGNPPADRQRRDRGDEPGVGRGAARPEEDERFAEAVAVATGDRRARDRAARRPSARAHGLVERRSPAPSDPRVVELERTCPGARPS